MVKCVGFAVVLLKRASCLWCYWEKIVEILVFAAKLLLTIIHLVFVVMDLSIKGVKSED